jgi:hypothetical protein
MVNATMVNLQGLASLAVSSPSKFSILCNKGSQTPNVVSECVSDGEDPVLCCLHLKPRRGLQRLLEQRQSHRSR